MSGPVTQSLRTQVVVAAAGDQSLGLEAVEGLGMGIFIEGGEVGLEGHVGLQFGEVDGLLICHDVIRPNDRRWTDRGKDRGHESGLHPAQGGMKWSTPGAGLLWAMHRSAQGVSRPETCPRRCRPLDPGLAIFEANRSTERHAAVTLTSDVTLRCMTLICSFVAFGTRWVRRPEDFTWQDRRRRWPEKNMSASLAGQVSTTSCGPGNDQTAFAPGRASSVVAISGLVRRRRQCPSGRERAACWRPILVRGFISPGDLSRSVGTSPAPRPRRESRA